MWNPTARFRQITRWFVLALFCLTTTSTNPSTEKPGRFRIGSIPEALAVSGFSRAQHLAFDDPKAVMESFARWIDEHSSGRAVFVSDNVAYDWQFINFYFHRFLGANPFGFSGRRIGDLYAGLVKDAYKVTEWKKFRVTPHTHNPVDDARGNAEALMKFRELGLKI